MTTQRVEPSDPPESSVDVLLRRWRDDPDGEVVRFVADGVRLTAAELVTGTAGVAGALRSSATGLSTGDAVITCLRPGAALVEVVYGVAAAGLIEVPLTCTVDEATARRMIDATRPALLAVGRCALADNPAVQAVLSRWRAAGQRAVLVDDRLGGRSALARIAAPSAELPDLAEMAADVEPWPLRVGALDPGAPGVVMATSGTTGAAKAALLPHFAGVRQARRVASTMGYGPGDVLLNFFPWNHINIRHAALLAAIGSGARLVVEPRFSASGFWERCRNEEVTAFHFMGAVAAILARREPGPADRNHRVRVAYGGPAPTNLYAPFAARFGVRLLESYASTELGDVTANTTRECRPGTAGRVLPEYEVAIRDEAGVPLPPGLTGGVSVRPRLAYMTFLEYVADREATDAVRGPDGWLRTGDRGYLDADGWFHYVGRRDDVIRRRGENLSVSELQTMVVRLPGAAEAVVVGVASDYTEQDVLLAVEPELDAELTDLQAHQWCVRELPRHAWPRYVRVGPLPHTESAKVDLAALAGPRFRALATDFDRFDERTTIDAARNDRG